MSIILIILWITVYLIYITSTFLHELNHKRKAEKYKLTILRSKKEGIERGLGKELSKLSFFIFGFEYEIRGRPL